MVVHHKAVDVVRREDAWQRRQVQASGSCSRAADECAIDSVLAGRVRAALQSLPEQQRDTLALAYYAGYTQREIAGATGVPLGTVKSRTVSGMARLRVLLARESADRGRSGGPGEGV